MAKTAKLFMNGRSQAVRLPADCRFPGKEVYIRRNPKTGEVTLSRKPQSWDAFLKLVEQGNIPQDFMNDRKQPPMQKRKLFE